MQPTSAYAPPVTDEDATLVKVVVGKPVCWGLTCARYCDCGGGRGTPLVSSNNVSAQGSGGGDGVLGTPNGLHEPVW